MINDNMQGWADNSVVVASIALAFGLVGARQYLPGVADIGPAGARDMP